MRNAFEQDGSGNINSNWRKPRVRISSRSYASTSTTFPEHLVQLLNNCSLTVCTASMARWWRSPPSSADTPRKAISSTKISTAGRDRSMLRCVGNKLVNGKQADYWTRWISGKDGKYVPMAMERNATLVGIFIHLSQLYVRGIMMQPPRKEGANCWVPEAQSRIAGSIEINMK